MQLLSTRAEDLQALLASIVESSTDAILTKTLEGSITSWNRAAERLYGYTAAEAIGQPVTLLIPPDHPDEFPALMARLQRGERVEAYDTVRLHKDGRRLDVSVAVSPLVAPDGRMFGASAVARDISERKQIEAEREAFTAALTHDIKSPLTTVLGTAQLLQRRLDRQGSLASAELGEGLARIEAGTTSTVRMLDALLDLARVRRGEVLELECGPCDLAALADGVMAEQQRLSPRHQLTLQAAGPVLVANCDTARLERVLTNLVANAVKYSPDGGPVTVTVTQDAAAQQAVLTVADQGLGIPAADLPRLFTAFHRGSNVVGRIAGAGIGLMSAKQLLEQQRGTIAVASEEGRGTTVTVRLPLA